MLMLLGRSLGSVDVRCFECSTTHSAIDQNLPFGQPVQTTASSRLDLSPCRPGRPVFAHCRRSLRRLRTAETPLAEIQTETLPSAGKSLSKAVRSRSDSEPIQLILGPTKGFVSVDGCVST